MRKENLSSEPNSSENATKKRVRHDVHAIHVDRFNALCERVLGQQ